MAKELKVGDMVFAKVKGHMPWPAVIERRLENNVYHVTFFGSEEVGDIHADNLWDYTQHKSKYVTVNKLKRAKFRQGVEMLESRLHEGGGTDENQKVCRPTVCKMYASNDFSNPAYQKTVNAKPLAERKRNATATAEEEMPVPSKRAKLTEPSNKCQECFKNFPHGSALVAHLRKNHKALEPVYLKVCPRWLQDTKLTTRLKLRDRGIIYYECSGCGRIDTKLTQHKLHVKSSHAGDAPKDPPLRQSLRTGKRSSLAIREVNGEEEPPNKKATTSQPTAVAPSTQVQQNGKKKVIGLDIILERMRNVVDGVPIEAENASEE